jgi:hypothetical protein
LPSDADEYDAELGGLTPSAQGVGTKRKVSLSALLRAYRFINGDVAMPRRPVEILDIDPMPMTI